MYVALARTVLTNVDHEKIVEEVRRFRQRYPGSSNADLAERLIRQTAFRSAVIGAVASAPPGLLAVVPLAADLSYQVLALNRLVLTIAYIYGRKTSHTERAGAVAASLGLGGAAEFLRRNIVKGVTRSLRRRQATHLVPVFGALLGGILSYATVRAIGRQTQQFYRPRTAVSRVRAIVNR
jgi:hypothetical protein